MTRSWRWTLLWAGIILIGLGGLGGWLLARLGMPVEDLAGPLWGRHRPPKAAAKKKPAAAKKAVAAAEKPHRKGPDKNAPMVAHQRLRTGDEPDPDDAADDDTPAAPDTGDQDDVLQAAMAGVKGPDPARAALQRCAINLQTVDLALRNYAHAHDHQFPKKLGELIPAYLPAIPRCPVARKDTFSPGYSVGSEFEVFTLTCAGRHHKAVGLGKGFPRLYSEGGLKLK